MPMPSDAVGPEAKRFASFAAFYPHYLDEHSNRSSRRLHFLGISLALVCLVALVATGQLVWLLAAIACGYGFAWSGHLFFERKPPGSLRQPVYSFMADWKMYWDTLRGRIPF